jgi:hypothetical protein
MKCRHCQHQNPRGSSFCLECRARLRFTCASCSTDLPAASKFCSQCGTAVGVSGAGQPRLTWPDRYTPKHDPERITHDHIVDLSRLLDSNSRAALGQLTTTTQRLLAALAAFTETPTADSDTLSSPLWDLAEDLSIALTISVDNSPSTAVNRTEFSVTGTTRPVCTFGDCCPQ